MCTLTLDLKVPFETEPLVGAPALTFSHWLPIGKEKGISVSEDGVALLLWFDLQSSWWASQPSEEDLKRYYNVLAHYVWAEITVSGVAPALASYMQTRDFTRLPNKSEKQIQSEYDKLGIRILRVLLKRTNRLIAYARARKGQYWLLEYGCDMDRLHGYFQRFESKGQIDGGKIFRFQPGVGDTIRIEMAPEKRYIREDEWDAVARFVQGDQRTPLVQELLAGAEQLARNGHTRSALTEAVTALEVAVSAFGRAQDKNGKLASICGPRLGVERVQKQIEHMGLSGTVSYLLPLLLPDSILPADVLAGCRDALTQRQNVVHGGQRDVVDIYRVLSCIRAFCKILDEFSRSEQSSL